MAITSIVDYLKSQGQDSSYAARKQLAAQAGITNYSGTAAQNMNLLTQLQKGSQASPEGASGVGKAAEAPSQNVLSGTRVSGSQGPVSGSVSSAGSSVARGNMKVSPSTETYYKRLQTQESSKPGSYKESDRVSDYYERLKDAESDKPGEFQSRYEDQINSILDSILNNKKFSYTADDLANDDLYQMYRENYTKQGEKAMRDTMGNAASLTGGYGSIYAAAAGQQAYDEYLSQLNDKALDFRDKAYQQYLNEQADRYNQMNVVTGLDNTDYSRYRDTVDDYWKDLSYLSGRYDTERNFDYGQYRDGVSDYYSGLSYLANRYDSEYGKDWDSSQADVAAEQWAKQFQFQQDQAAQEQARWEAEMALQREQFEYQKSKAAASSGRGSSGSSKKSTKKTEGYTSTKGYTPFSANLSSKLAEGKISDYDALEKVMQEMEKGNFGVDDAEAIIQDAGIDKNAAIAEEVQKSLKINNLNDLYFRRR